MRSNLQTEKVLVHARLPAALSAIPPPRLGCVRGYMLAGVPGVCWWRVVVRVLVRAGGVWRCVAVCAVVCAGVCAGVWYTYIYIITPNKYIHILPSIHSNIYLYLQIGIKSKCFNNFFRRFICFCQYVYIPLHRQTTRNDTTTGRRPGSSLHLTKTLPSRA